MERKKTLPEWGVALMNLAAPFFPNKDFFGVRPDKTQQLAPTLYSAAAADLHKGLIELLEIVGCKECEWGCSSVIPAIPRLQESLLLESGLQLTCDR